MILPDVNVLLYAFRRDSADHSRYRDWLDAVVNGPAVYGMSFQVLASVIRIATNPKVYAQPSQLSRTIEFADLLQSQPNCRPVMPGPRHWAIYTDLLRSARATGNLAQNAWLAALAVEHGCEWITSDGDFGRFPGLQWKLL